LLGFYSFCRRSEILAIQYEDLIFSDDGSIQVRINFSKTDQTGVGRVIDLPKKEDQYCPVKSLNEWLEIVQVKSGPLFYKINKSKVIESHKLNKNKGFVKRSLTAAGFVKILKKRSKNVGIDSVNIGAHSLRIGAITQSRMDNVPTHEIMAQSGHSTTQMIDRYTKVTDIKKNSAARKI
jgi:integrase